MIGVGRLGGRDAFIGTQNSQKQNCKIIQYIQPLILIVIVNVFRFLFFMLLPNKIDLGLPPLGMLKILVVMIANMLHFLNLKFIGLLQTQALVG